MKVKIVTDSTSDIPARIAGELDISVVPIYVRFGEATYRDGIEMSSDEFYARLDSSPVHPATSQPAPEDFLKTYRPMIENSDGIISIHISSKISGTYNSALLAKKMLESSRPIEVVDSRFNSAGLGLVAMAAAKVAKAGAGFTDVLAETRRAVSQVQMFGMFNTMKYLALSGRVSKTIASAAKVLDVKPLLTFKDGDIVRAGLVRTFSKGMERIYDFAARKNNIREMAIVHSSVPEWAGQLKKRLGAIFPEEKILVSQLGAALGVHGGKGVLLVALRQAPQA
ncbi:MAG: DegV family protein [Dehalococcoidia bacterium]|nr:DegV family protein [Dehalococcoidia bacterium]MDD5494425.1 DegV family protein [Dehalococcoidia bacterium]